MTAPHRWAAVAAFAVIGLCTSAVAGSLTPPPLPVVSEEAIAPAEASAPSLVLPTGTRSGLDIYRNFREGLADPECEPGASDRWRQHFSHMPKQLATPGTDVLPLFGYVVDALREASLPTEYALIPFVESGYRPGARSPSGPVGLWQFIAVTARNHKVPIVSGYDGRLSAVESTNAAVRYLKTLHGMFAGDWRLAVMAYNAGEYRVLGALRRAGQVPASAEPEKLALPAITHAYVRKLHALSCLLEEAEERDAWLDALDRPVVVLAPVPAPAGDLDTFTRRNDLDPVRLRRLNPAHAGGRIAAAPSRMLLAPMTEATMRLVAATQPSAPAPAPAPAIAAASGFMNMAPPEPEPVQSIDPRVHTVARGESVWAIARRYGIRNDELLARNGLDARSVLQPGMELRIDAAPAEGAPPGVAE